MIGRVGGPGNPKKTRKERRQEREAEVQRHNIDVEEWKPPRLEGLRTYDGTYNFDKYLHKFNKAVAAVGLWNPKRNYYCYV